MAVSAEPIFRLWPPSETTRAMLVEKMATNLASISFMSSKFGRIDTSEATKHAKRIEEAAFAAAEQRGEGPDTEIVQMYAKQASQLMLDALKSAGQKETFFDISGGKRGFLTKEHAESLLQPLMEPGNSYSKLCLSNWSFGRDAGSVAGRVLAGVKQNLVDVNLADIVAGRSEAEALEVMAMFSSALAGSNLLSLNLSDNALGEKGVRAFGALLQSQKSLQALYFMNNGISEEAANAICELLPSAKELRTLHFHNNMSGDGGAQALSGFVEKATLLESFQFSSTRVGVDGGIALARALQAGKSLKRIDVRDNMFGPDGGIALAKTLCFHPDLTEAYLSELGLEDEGVLALSKSLSEAAPSLRILELSSNEITENCAPALAKCLASKKFLSKVNLAENELKDKGAVIICNALKEGSKMLKELDLSYNAIGRVGTVAAAQAVAEKQGFRILNIDGNRISTCGLDAVRDILDKGMNGSSVLGPLDENDEDEDEDEDEEAEVDERRGSNENGMEEHFHGLNVID